jgi:hypothetical protein
LPKPVHFQKGLCLFAAILLRSFTSFGQIGGSFQEIYSGSGCTISISFRINPKSCIDGETACSYKYKVKGRYTGNKEYLNWSIVIRDCNGELKRKFFGEPTETFKEEGVKMNPADYKFTCMEMISEVEKDQTGFSNQPKRNTEPAGKLSSTPARSISGPNEVYVDLPATLNVVGGELGLGAQWAWYRNRTDTLPSRFGESITVAANEAGTWYVRAESKSSKVAPSDFVNKIITYNPGVLPAKGIGGKLQACPNTRIRLTPEQGSVGESGQWAWFSGSCDGKLLKRSREPFLELDVSESLDIFLRAEADGAAPSSCVSARVQVVGKNPDPGSLMGPLEVCEGEPITLTVDGSLLSGNKWDLLRGMCNNGTVIQTSGQNQFSFNRLPAGEYTFSVRASGECGTTRCVYLKMQIIGKTQMPFGINIVGKIIRKTPFTATPSGGRISKPTEWNWYFGNSFKDKSLIGIGETLTYRPKRNGVLFLRPENNKCDRSEDYVQLPIYPGKAHTTHRYFNTIENYRKVLHYGFTIGVEVAHYSDEAPFISTSSIPNPFYKTAMAYGTGFGWRLGFEFNPLYTKYASLGLKTNFIANLGRINEEENTIRYRAIINEITFTAGSNGVKFLGKIQNANEDVSLNTKRTMDIFDGYARFLNRKQYSLGYALGVRVGGALRKDGQAKPGRALDVYFLNRNSTENIEAFFNPEMGYRHGFGIQYWTHSMIQTGMEMLSSERNPGFFPNGLPNLKNTHFRLSFVVSIDGFY